MDKEPKLTQAEGEVGAGGVNHHVSHLLLIARHRKHYSEKHLVGSITALERLKNNVSGSSEAEKADALLDKLKSIDVNASVDLSLLNEIQSDLKNIKD